jgi:hypothetical protein
MFASCFAQLESKRVSPKTWSDSFGCAVGRVKYVYLTSVAEPHNFFVAPAPATTLLYSRPSRLLKKQQI